MGNYEIHCLKTNNRARTRTPTPRIYARAKRKTHTRKQTPTCAHANTRTHAHTRTHTHTRSHADAQHLPMTPPREDHKEDGKVYARRAKDRIYPTTLGNKNRKLLRLLIVCCLDANCTFAVASGGPAPPPEPATNPRGAREVQK